MGIENGTDNPYPDPYPQDKSLVEDTDTTPGDGGGDMQIWSADRVDQLDSLIQQSYENLSGYALPAGVTDTLEGYGVSVEDIEKNVVRDENTEPGDGGGVMDAWTESREYKLNNLTIGNFTNEATYPIPPGVIDAGGYGIGISDSEKWMGYSAFGSAQGYDSLPMSGKVSFTGDGNLLDSEDQSGFLAANTGPHGGVVEGADGDGLYDVYKWEFKPEGGISSSGEFSPPGPGEISTSYGRIEGEVTDADGDPVKNELVSGEGAKVNTDSTGTYVIDAPGGETIELTSISGTTTKSTKTESQEISNLDFSFAGFEVTIEGPNKTPIEGVPVEVDAGPTANLRTDSSGAVKFVQLPAQDVTATIAGEIEREESMSEGYTNSILVESTTGVSGRARVPSSGSRPGDVDIRVEILDEDGDIVKAYESISNEDGTFGVGMFDTGEIRVTLSREDRRYSASSSEAYLEEGEELEVVVDLERQENIGTVV